MSFEERMFPRFGGREYATISLVSPSSAPLLFLTSLYFLPRGGSVTISFHYCWITLDFGSCGWYCMWKYRGFGFGVRALSNMRWWFLLSFSCLAALSKIGSSCCLLYPLCNNLIKNLLKCSFLSSCLETRVKIR